nr:hypothetical protein [Gemmatimonadaceae bacterium]
GLSFNGTSSYVSVPNNSSWNASFTTYTVACWVKVNEIKDYAAAIAVGDWSGQTLSLYTRENRWFFGIHTSGGPNNWVCAGWTPPIGYLTTVDNQFHHVALVLDIPNSTGSLYSDGVLLAQDIYIDGLVDLGANNLYFGGFGTSNRLACVLDDVRLYSDALSEAEIQALAPPTGAPNQAPTFVKGADIAILEDASPNVYPGWATQISAGPASESSQQVQFVVIELAPLTPPFLPSIFTSTPTVAPDGTLSFTLVPDASGYAQLSVYAKDNGGTANGGTDASPPQMLQVSVAPVNDAPFFSSIPDIFVLEDSGQISVPNWATDIHPGPDSESNQLVELSVMMAIAEGQNEIFSGMPTIDQAGTLSFSLIPHSFGTQVLVDVIAEDDGGTANGGVDRSLMHPVRVHVTNVNDAPDFTAGADQVVLEDSGAHSVPGWATAITAGPREIDQSVSFSVTTTNGPLFSTPPAISATGTLTYTVAANANGEATISVVANDDGGNANGGISASAVQTATITVTGINDAPSFVTGADQSVLEDAVSQTVSLWATGIDVGGPEESSQSPSFTVTSDNPSLFSIQPIVSPLGALTYKPAANAHGSATISVVAHDDGGTAENGVDASVAQTATIVVTPVNDPPTCMIGSNQKVGVAAGPQSVSGFVNAISPGPSESGQAVTFIVTTSDSVLFAVQPAIAANGTLTYA